MTMRPGSETDDTTKKPEVRERTDASERLFQTSISGDCSSLPASEH
jgi:hypothetical protein